MYGTGVVFHHHLFKNAGTSLDGLAKAHPRISTVFLEPCDGSLLREDNLESVVPEGNRLLWVSSHSHSLLRVRPNNPRSLRLAVVREPISRVLSVYEFEKKQGKAGVGGESARLANELPMASWLDWHFQHPGRGPILNYHVSYFRRALGLSKNPRAAVTGKELLDIVSRTFELGLFEQLSQTVERWAKRIEDDFSIKLDSRKLPHLNSTYSATSTEEAIAKISDEIGESGLDRLRSLNYDDIEFYACAQALLSDWRAES